MSFDGENFLLETFLANLMIFPAVLIVIEAFAVLLTVVLFSSLLSSIIVSSPFRDFCLKSCFFINYSIVFLPVYLLQHNLSHFCLTSKITFNKL